VNDTDGHHPQPPSELEARTLALESLLIERGLLTADDVDSVIEMLENDIGPMIGARGIARAWVDADFKALILKDAKEAFRRLGVTEHQAEELVVVENTDSVHNMVVCTLCSCYPWMVLGLPPTWYKSAPYRARAVLEPRSVLSEMGVQLDESVEVRVWDSSADTRHMVLPARPAGTEDWSETQLASIVTRDCMIGVAVPEGPDNER
jgi:nitrile hydratase